MTFDTKPIPSTLDDIFKEEDALIEAGKQLQLRQSRVAAAKQIMMQSSKTHLLAIKLHDKLCRWNHTDGCAWHYAIKNGVHDWNEDSHKEYLRKANRIMNYLTDKQIEITCDNVTEFIDVLCG